jgi:hypothetical protein
VIPSPDPYLFALAELVPGLGFLVFLVIRGRWMRRVARRAAEQSTAPDRSS